jgi:hypothetical protein
LGGLGVVVNATVPNQLSFIFLAYPRGFGAGSLHRGRAHRRGPPMNQATT